MKNVMKKKMMYLFIVVALIAANLLFTTIPTPGKKSDLTLVLLEARADDPPEADPPGGTYPPTRKLLKQMVSVGND